jgi:Leucine-rich repeat (LRR) protein
MKKLSLIIIALFTSALCNSQVIEQDSLALVSLYNSMNGNNWYYNNNWLVNPVETWQGITVANNRVTEISLGMNNLVGSIPEEIGNLDSLSILDLSGDSIFSIPLSIGNLTTLDTLDLFGTKVDSLPPTIGELQDLKFLDLSFSQIHYLPLEIGNLSKLEYLIVYDADLMLIPETIGGMNSLKVLDLALNQISNFPSSLGNCIHLNNLTLNANNISSVPPEIGNLTNLETLILGKNNMNSLPAELFNLTNLRMLNFAANNLLQIPTSIGNLIHLENFQFFENNITEIPSEIGNLTELSYINGYSNKIEELPLSLLNLTNVTTLFLSYNSLTFDDIEPLVIINGFEYWKQDSIGQHIDTIVPLNTTFRLECITGGQHNKYQWFKDGDSIPGADSNFIEFSAINYADSGTYYCVINNSLATGLTLFARSIKLRVTNPSSIIEIRANESEEIFVFPNPSKGIVTIQSNRKSTTNEFDLHVLNSEGVEISVYPSNHFGNIKFDSSKLDPGIYFVQLIDKQSMIKSKIKKLVVE